MDDVVFVRSRTVYQSYSDFWKLVELSGFPVIYGPPDLQQKCTYIFAECNADFYWPLADTPKKNRRSRVILWSIERPDSRASTPESAKDMWFYGMSDIRKIVDEVWVSDRWIHKIDPSTRYVVLGGHPGLKNDTITVSQVYDVAHIGQRTSRRERVIQDLQARGISVSPNAWGSVRAGILWNARLMLSVDRLEGVHVAAPLRWALAAAYRLPLVQESLEDPYPLVPWKSVLMAPVNQLADCIQYALTNGCKNIGEELWGTMCSKYTFQRGVEEALRGG